MSRLHRKRRRAFIESYTFPPALRVKLAKEFPDDRHVAVALEGLREWYLACLAAPGETLGMPSRAVDVAWHEMILMTRSYHAFCDRAFGHYLHHSPEAVMDEPISESLARTLAVLERQSPAIGRRAAAVRRSTPSSGLADGFVWQAHDLAHVRGRPCRPRRRLIRRRRRRRRLRQQLRQQLRRRRWLRRRRRLTVRRTRAARPGRRRRRPGRGARNRAARARRAAGRRRSPRPRRARAG